MKSLTSLTSDVVFAFRSLVGRSRTTGLAILALALGIGASTAMFSILNSVLVRPLPYPEPEALVSLYPTNPHLRGHPTLRAFAERGTFSIQEFFWIAEHQTIFDAVGAYRTWGGPTLSGDGEAPERLSWVRASPGLLPALDVEPLLGRPFREEDDPRRGARTVMLTERFWTARFARDPDVIGGELRLNEELHTVIGILPEGVADATAPADVWVLLTGSSSEGHWGSHNVSGALGRLREGATIEQARSELSRLMADVPPESQHEHAASVFPRLQDRTRNVRPALVALTAAALGLLAVGCGNVATLLIAAGIDRQQEIALRRALGAARGQIVRLFLTEGAMLTAAGTAAGVGVALALNRVLVAIAPPGVPRLEQAAVDGHALLFAIGVATLASLFFGIVPALYFSGGSLSAVGRASSRIAQGRSKLQAAVVVSELALTVLLLVSAALLGRTLLAVQRVDLGFDPEGLYEVRVALPYHRFEDVDDRHARTQALDDYFAEIVAAVASTPGVDAVAVTDVVPLTPDRGNNELAPEGWDPAIENESLLAERRFVSSNYFETARIRLREGRGFRPTDDHPNAPPVTVISEGLARRVWPSESAVGKRIAFWGREPATVVGVAPNLRDEELTSPTGYAFYVPARQVGEQVGALLVRLEPERDPGSVLAELRPRIWEVDPDVPITRIASFEELFADAIGGQRYRARLMIAFSVLAGVFAFMGVYGVTARFVAGRTRELGIRTALGANRGRVLALVLRQGFRLAAVGAAVGLLASVATTRLLAGLLFGVSPVDPLSLVSIAALVAAACLGASLPPAWDATRIAPSEALRVD